jgi:hypothetical protein
MDNPEVNNNLIFLDDDNSSLYDEDKLILDVTTTPYEKVLKILGGMKNFLHDLGKVTLKSDVQLSDILSLCSVVNLFEVTEDLNWVIKRIQSHTLYTYEISEEDDLEKLKKDNLEMQSFLEMLSDYSEAKEIKRRNKMPISRTHKLQEKPLLLRQHCLPSLDKTYETPSAYRKKNRESILMQMTEEIKKDEYKTEAVTHLESPGTSLRKYIEKKNNEEKKDIKLDFNKNDEIKDSSNAKTENGEKIEKSTNMIVLNSPKAEESHVDSKTASVESNKLLSLNIDKKIAKDKKNVSNKLLINMVNEEEKKTNKLTIHNNQDNNNANSMPTSDKNYYININTEPKDDDNNKEKSKEKIGENPLIRLIKIDDSINSSNNTGLPKISIFNENQQIAKDLKVTWDKYHLCDPNIMLTNDFNIHEFNKTVGRNNVLPYIGKMIFTAFDLTYLIDTNKLDSFLDTISRGYLDVPYHNCIHGADVTQTLANWIFNSKLEEMASLTDNEILAVLSASLAHDIGHPGTNNAFQLNSYSDYAITYNDQSILENYHCSLFFRLCRKSENNIYSKLTDAEYRQFRKRIIECIIATDMVFHAKIVSQMKGKIMTYKDSLLEQPESSELVPMISKDSTTLFDEQQFVLNFMIHTADIAHNSKPFKISQKWTEYLMEEFWQQGDKEKKMGLPISFLCDRTTADVPKGQIGFFKAIIMPTFDALVDMLPDLTNVREQINKNYEEWGKLIDENKPVTLFAKSPRLLKSPMVSGRNTYNTNRQGTTSGNYGSFLGLGNKKTPNTLK